jgi:hypothetical protein
MDSQVPVSVGWAVWGKRPNSTHDYSILASSTEPLSPAEYARILTHFAPGTPPGERDTPGSLPWVTFSQVGVEERPYLGISIQDFAGQVDAAGRPIAETSYFCVPYAELAQPPVSCIGLYETVAGLDLPRENGIPMKLSASPLDAQTLASLIRGFGEELVTATAALLLDGPVTIIGADSLKLRERLQYIDAVAALLPFGYRAGYTAATWSDGGADPRIRLAFSNRSEPGAAVVQWPSPPARIAPDMAARTYQELLTGLLGRQTDDGDPLAELIRSLAAQAQPPRMFDQPQHAIASLREIDLPSQVLDAVRDGVAAPTEIRRVFASGRVAELPADSRPRLLEELIAFGNPKDWPTVTQCFDQVAGVRPGEMLNVMVTTCRKLLWSPAPSELVHEHLVLAARYRIEDELLAGLMALPDPPERLRQGLSEAAQLLGERVLATPDSAARFPLTQQALQGNPAVACELLKQLSGSAVAVGAAIAWLRPVLGRFLLPFIDVLGDPPCAVDQQVFRQLAVNGETWVRTLLLDASYARRLDYAVPGFASWLAGNYLEPGPAGDAMRQYWQETIGALAPTTATARAWLDLALLIMGKDPRFMLADPGDRQGFNNSFVGAWQMLASEQQAVDGLLTAVLTGYLSRQPWTADVGSAVAVTDIAGQLTENGGRSRLEVIVARMLASTPGAASWDFAARWLARMDAAPGGTLESLRYLPAGSSSAQIAESCLRVEQNGVPPRVAGQALAESGIVASGAWAVAVLAALRQALAKEPARLRAWRAVLVELYMDGTFGGPVAEEFPALAFREAYNEIGYRLALFRTVACGGREDAPPKLSDSHIEAMERLQKYIGGIIRDARKGSGRRRLR